jgi:hypothetical protein
MNHPMRLTQRVELHDGRFAEIRARWQPVGEQVLYDMLVGNEIVQRIPQADVKRAIGEPRL